MKPGEEHVGNFRAHRCSGEMETADSSVLGRKRQSEKLFSDFNTLQFASVMGMVLFVILLVFMTIPTHDYRHVSADIPKVLHPVSLPGAVREDAMTVTVTRDGKLFFGIDRVIPGTLSARIVERLKDRSVERKVYIVADAGARWGSVKPVLDGVRSAGIMRVAFLAYPR